MLIRNPYTILKNTKALFRSPFFPESSGAIYLRDLEPLDAAPMGVGAKTRTEVTNGPIYRRNGVLAPHSPSAGGACSR